MKYLIANVEKVLKLHKAYDILCAFKMETNK